MDNPLISGIGDNRLSVIGDVNPLGVQKCLLFSIMVKGVDDLRPLVRTVQNHNAVISGIKQVHPVLGGDLNIVGLL
ncbi:hypothetical protein D3C75_525050 [compost metagenome]